MSAEVADAADPRAVAQRFLRAVYEGDPDMIWTLFSNGARSFVVSRGVRRGLSYELGQALLNGTAESLDQTEFLADLLAGIEKDLATVDLGRVIVTDQVEEMHDGRMRVRFLEEFAITVGPLLDALPVGSLDVVDEAGTWKVDRLIPKPG